MLHLLDESLEALLREAVPLPERDVDIAFEAPDRDWGARITRPTVNLFLWDIQRNLDETDAGFELQRDPSGRTVRRTPPPRVDCRYLVTAWTSEVRDEHALLGAVLRTLLVTPRLEPAHLAGSLADVRPLPAIRAVLPGGPDSSDLWSALGGQLKPGLDLVITTTVDAITSFPAGPPVRRYTLRMRDTDGPSDGSAGGSAGRADSSDGSAEDAAAGRSESVVWLGGEAPGAAPGTLVTTTRGATEVRADGRYVAAVADDEEPVVDH